ncbi:TetR/AcrR family transcriptional regulator [Pseudomonas sp. CGJS7]|uniref:TetR/AcrR family transcriptional regulator n=1 Tax=Pseudomonas sp. CGJS7 TaxID=3109348 RepID=UPI00300ADAEB
MSVLSPVAAYAPAFAPAAVAPADDHEALRAAALDAAERLFIERGTRRVGLSDIAAAAGLPLRALRRCYPSSERLQAAVETRFVQRFCAHAAQAMDRCRDGDWSARLRAWVRAAVDGYLDHVALHDAVFHDLRTHDRQQWQDNPVVDQLVELLEGGIAARVWAAPDPRMTAVIFFTVMHSAVDRVIACGDPSEDPAQVRHRLAQTVIGHFERTVQWWTRY